jgi:site-specific DNA-methyltransferase (adenine-specific)
MQKYDREGRLHFPANPTGALRLKMYADESPGERFQNIWTDIPPIAANAAERLGYPTQKPVALLERIIKASSNPNDIVLDGFCGCGTALVAAEKLSRQWIGIDISHTACCVMAKRLRGECKLREGEALRAAGKGFAVRNLPRTEKELRQYPPFEFQNWAVLALGAVCGPRGADGGIDGRFFFADSPPTSDPSALGFMDDWYPVQVKQEDKAGRPEIMNFEAVMTRDKRSKGYFVAFGFTQDALDEARRFMLSDHRHIIPLTVSEILDGSFAEKMA